MGRVRVKLAIFGDDSIESPIVKEETLLDVVNKVLGDVDLSGRKIAEVFTVVVDGNIIKEEQWAETKVDETSIVFITPTLGSVDDPSSIIRGVLLIAVVAVATFYLGPGGAAGLSGFTSALAVSGASFAGAMLVNALIPPSMPTSSPLANLSGNIGDSQMYSVSGQTNQLKRHSFVPKVYGEHVIFPNIAANPYVEVEQVEEGKFIQTLYAIYDLGLGPAYVNQVKIGDTPFENFADAEYRIVDLNKPATREGPWDDQSVNYFTHYKGQVDTVTESVALDGNALTPGTPQDSYEVIRNLGSNPENLEQKYTLEFVMPQGLYSLSSSGTRGTATIGLEIHVQKIGTSEWIPVNDLDRMSEFKSSGGFQEYEAEFASLFPGPLPSYYSNLGANGQAVNLYATEAEINGATLPAKTGNLFQARAYDWGFPANTTPNVVLHDEDLQDLIIGRSLRSTLQMKVGGPTLIFKITKDPISAYLGKIKSRANHNANYSVYTMDRKTTYSIPIIRQYVGTLNSTPPRNITRWSDFQSTIMIEKSVDGKVKIQRNSTAVQYATISFTPRSPGEYRVRIRRTNTTSDYSFQSFNSLVFTGVQTRTNKPPIVTDKRHVFLEVKIRATNQLNGVIQNLSCVVQSALRYTLTTLNGQGQLPSIWTQSNPAWVFVDLLTGEINKRAIPLSRLHIPSIVEWAEYCEEIPDEGDTGMIYDRQRFEANFVLDYPTTLQGILNQVCALGQASMNIIDGKYGVLIDKQKTTPVQIFTPRNSRDFSSQRVYSVLPHALVVKYIDAGNDYTQAEAIVYDNGYDESNAETFEELVAFGCTNFQQAWRYGRYMLAQNRLRQETISITVDFEHLVCTRGDYVMVTQDVMKVGGFPARCKTSSAAPGTITFTIDDSIEAISNESYGVTWRAQNGTIRTRAVTVINSNTFQFVDTVWPNVGDLVVIGIMGDIVFDCIVKAIRPNADMSATLILVEKADAIYDAESSSVFPNYSPDISKTSTAEYKPPGPVRNLRWVNWYYKVVGKAYETYVLIQWTSPLGAAFEKFEIYVDSGDGYNLVDTTRQNNYTYLVPVESLGIEIDFKVLAVSANGKKIDIATAPSISGTAFGKTAPPNPVEGFSLDITNETMTLLWDKSKDPDILEYRIRYSSNIEMASWSRSIPLLKAEASVTSASVQARTGVYLIKSVDFNGKECNTAKAVITTIPNLFNLNFITTMNDGDTWPGQKIQTERLESGIILKQEISGGPADRKYFEEGFYYFSDILEFDDIYTVRAQSTVDAIGFAIEDVMSNWETLSLVTAMQSAQPDDWGVEVQYRATTELNTMSDWVTLSAIESMDAGQPTIWTPWRSFTIGDLTGKRIQFRVRLISVRSNVTPFVLSASITVDTPDRLESYNGQMATAASGKTINYSPHFLGPEPTPNIQITIENGQAGDYYEFLNRDLEGFTVKFFNSSSVAVDRTFDAAVKGYGRKATEVI